MRPTTAPRPSARPFLRTVTGALAFLVAAAAATMPTPSSAQQNAAPTANPADVESIDAIITALYDVISGDAGVARDWDRFLSLFAPGGTLSPVGRPPGESTYQRRVITPDEYAEGVGESLEANGFHEVEIQPGDRGIRPDCPRLQHLRVAEAGERSGAIRARDQLDPADERRLAVVGRVDLLAR